VSVSGKCLEGFEPVDTCPYMSVATEAEGVLTTERSPGNFIDLPQGEALSEDQAGTVASNGLSRVVILAGPVGSGKTTILTALFEAFLEAPFGNYLFAGSQTLIGFERRCHDARVSSGRLVGETAHTSVREGIRFLHLRLAATEKGTSTRKHLLLSDISGEIFVQLRDSGSAVRDMKVLGRADHICIIIDGDKLLEPETRHIARNDARAILRSILEAEVLSPSCRIDVIFSKWDLVVSSKQSTEVISYVEQTRKAFAKVIGERCAVIFHEIAARPESKALPFAHGLPTLLRSWMTEPDIPQRRTLYLTDAENERELARLVRRVAATPGLEDAFNVRWI